MDCQVFVLNSGLGSLKKKKLTKLIWVSFAVDTKYYWHCSLNSASADSWKFCQSCFPLSSHTLPSQTFLSRWSIISSMCTIISLRKKWLSAVIPINPVTTGSIGEFVHNVVVSVSHYLTFEPIFKRAEGGQLWVWSGWCSGFISRHHGTWWASMWTHQCLLALLQGLLKKRLGYSAVNAWGKHWCHSQLCTKYISTSAM